MFIYFILSLYPLYLTCEDIRLWNKVKKINFQRWCIFWIVFWTLYQMRLIISYIWFVSWILPLFDCFLAFMITLMCFYPTILPIMRKLVVLPIFSYLKSRNVLFVPKHLIQEKIDKDIFRRLYFYVRYPELEDNDEKYKR